VSIWDDLTAEERVILTNAIEEAWLNEVIGDYLGHAEQDGTVWMFSTDSDAIRPLIPRFAAIVKGMIDKDLIELVPSALYQDWPNTHRMTDAEIDAALADSKTWLPSEGTGPIMLITTDHADRELGR
jgi:hypothetical protein